jgi:hypothetical protein
MKAMFAQLWAALSTLFAVIQAASQSLLNLANAAEAMSATVHDEALIERETAKRLLLKKQQELIPDVKSA